MEVGHQEADVVALETLRNASFQCSIIILGDVLYLDGFSAQNNEVIGSHHHESHELVTQNVFNFIRL